MKYFKSETFMKKLAQFSSVVKPTVGRSIAELSFSAPPSQTVYGSWQNEFCRDQKD